MINMEAIPKFDIKSVIKSDIKFDISTKLTTWIGHMNATSKVYFTLFVLCLLVRNACFCYVNKHVLHFPKILDRLYLYCITLFLRKYSLIIQ